MAARNEEAGKQIAPWIGSVHYGPLESEANSIMRGMGLLGNTQFTRRALDYYIARYNAQGFLTTGYTLMGTGWHLRTLGEFFQWTGDTGWLTAHADEVARVGQWIADQRAKTASPPGPAEDFPEQGLIPPGVMADWENYAYYFCLNGYFCAGLREAGAALTAIGHPAGPRMQQEAADYAKAIRRAFAWSQARTPLRTLRNGTWTPGSPASVYTPGPIGGFFPAEDANRSWCYDIELGPHHLVGQGVLAPDAPETDAIMDVHEDFDFLQTGWVGGFPAEKNEADWFNLGGFSKVQPYYTRNGEIYALRGDVKPFLRSYFNTIPSLLNREDLSFWEHFVGSCAWNKTHETGYFLQQTRFMLVIERGDELWLASLIPAAWLADGQKVGVTGAPTRFGTVGYTIQSHVNQGEIAATIQPPARKTPQALVLRLRHPEGKPMRGVTVNGRELETFDPETALVRIERPGSEPLHIVARY
jgi:hypothetical protein